MRFLLFMIGGFIFLILSPFLFFFRTEVYQLEYLVALFYLQSRAALLALAAGILFLLKDRIISMYKKIPNRFARWLSWSMALLLFVSVVAYLYSLRPDSANGRLLIWQAGWKMFCRCPFLGWGFDGFRRNYMFFQEKLLAESESTRFINLASDNGFAFNEFLKLGVEQGLTGGVAVLFILGLLFRRSRMVTYCPERLVLKSILLSLLVFGCFSYPSEAVPFQVVMVAGIAGLACISGTKVEIDQSVKNDTRVNKILETLMDINDSYLKKLIARYQGGVNFNLYFKIDGTQFGGKFSNLNGLCYYDSNGATIYLKPDYLEGAKAIEIARTLLHEGLHAYINSLNYQAAPIQANTLDEAWTDYVKKSNHHEAMATREVDNMARELERIHKTLPEYKKGWEENASNILPEERIWYYKKLVWDGLQKTDAYQKISAEDRDKMQKIYKDVFYFWSREWR